MKIGVPSFRDRHPTIRSVPSACSILPRRRVLALACLLFTAILIFGLIRFIGTSRPAAEDTEFPGLTLNYDIDFNRVGDSSFGEHELPAAGHYITPEARVETPGGRKPLYYWHTMSKGLLTSPTEQDAFFTVSAAEEITDVYLSEYWWGAMYDASKSYIANHSLLGSFIGKCNARGLNVHILLTWPTGGPSNTIDYAWNAAYVREIIRYNQSGQPRIKGIIWDIEPIYDLTWEMRNFLHAMKQVTYSRDTIVSQGLELSLYGPAPRFFADQAGAKAMIMELTRYDISTYSDDWDHFLYTQIADGPDKLESWGMPWIFGLELQPLSSGDYTLYEEGLTAYRALYQQAVDYFTPRYTTFRGGFVHTFEMLRKWYGF